MKEYVNRKKMNGDGKALMIEMINKFGKFNVLLVDDDEELCEIMKFYLYKIEDIKSIVTVHDGVSASQKLRNQKFDVILLDMRMPRRNGYDLLDEFRDNPFNSVASVLAMSGTLDMDVLTIATYHGVKSFLVKPFDENLFLEKVKGLLIQQKENVKVAA